MKSLTLKARAKINLGLDVIGKRPDGYHEVRMVMQSVDLFDTLSFEQVNEPGIHLFCDAPGVPADERNLAYRAAALLMETFDVKEGVRIGFEKRIPASAGLAGGSTDAAAALRGVSELFSLGLTAKELCAYGVKIGADVPFCVMGGTMLAEGIGERLTPLLSCPETVILLAKPAEGLSTAGIYTKLDALTDVKHPDIDGLLAGLAERSLDKMIPCMGNILEAVSIPTCPVIESLKDAMKKEGALLSLMSGSGPTVFGFFADMESAEAARRAVLSCGATVAYVTRPAGPNDFVML